MSASVIAETGVVVNMEVAGAISFIIIIINGRYRLQLTSAIVYIKRGNLHQAGKCTAFFSMIVAMAANIRRQIDSITCLFPFLL